MRFIETCDYEKLGILLRDFTAVWIRSQNGNLQFYLYGSKISLPVFKVDNLSVCEKYAKENKNFAYIYDSSSHKITIWDKSVEEYEAVFAPAFKEVDTCGMGLYSYKKYSDSITELIPTYKMREAAESIACDFWEFKHKK